MLSSLKNGLLMFFFDIIQTLRNRWSFQLKSEKHQNEEVRTTREDKLEQVLFWNSFGILDFL